MSEKRALYFGCWDGLGHFLKDVRGRHVATEEIPGFPWNIGHLDTGLLKNGRHDDVCDGRVFWTCGGRSDLWHAFFWWDRSVDHRSNSNSGFYVSGFDFVDLTDQPQRVKRAFAYACDAFRHVVIRQKFPLTLIY